MTKPRPSVLAPLLAGVLLALAAASKPTIAAGTAASPPPAPPACHPVDGLAPILKPGTILLLGEIHGTRESPAFVTNAACLAARSGTPVTVALEIPDPEAPRVAAYLASEGAAADRAALLAGDFWRRTGQDGRSSQAMVDLIESVRRIARQGYSVRLRLVDREVEARDRFMADQVKAEAESAPGAVVLVLTGNLHTRTKDGTPWDPKRPNMGAFLVKDLPGRRVLALDVSYSGGDAWACIPDMQHCGIHPMKGSRAGEAERAVLYPRVDELGYGGYYHVGKLTAAAPSRSGGSLGASRPHPGLPPSPTRPLPGGRTHSMKGSLGPYGPEISRLTLSCVSSRRAASAQPELRDFRLRFQFPG